MAKMKHDDILGSDFFQAHSGAAVEAYFEITRPQELGFFNEVVRCCESPLEAAFMCWALALYRDVLDDDLYLLAQLDIDANGKKYRPDFQFVPQADGRYSDLAKRGDWTPVVVELDGHEWHERTPEQVSRRNQRDIDLQANGYLVVHISGSEFHRDPRSCVTNVFNLAIQKFDSKVESRNNRTKQEEARTHA